MTPDRGPDSIIDPTAGSPAGPACRGCGETAGTEFDPITRRVLCRRCWSTSDATRGLPGERPKSR